MIGHTDRNLTESPAISGNNPLDEMQNIYDLEGNYLEWTAEANLTYGTHGRASRGGSYDSVSNSDFYPASYRLSYYGPSNASSDFTSRAGLYVNI